MGIDFCEFELATRWNVSGGLDDVVAVFREVEAFPRWWRPVFVRVAVVDAGTAAGVGRVAILTTRGFLPYILRWRIRIIDSWEPFGFSFLASGDLAGRGEWMFRQAASQVEIELRWKVAIEKPLLRALAPVLKPLLVRNHRWAMDWGERGLQTELLRRQKS